jgi:hypothetical protein
MRLRLLALAVPIGLLAALGGSAADARTNADTLLSQGKPVIASSIEADTFAARMAVDGKMSTRWASAEGSDPQWIRADLGYSLWELEYPWVIRALTGAWGVVLRPVRRGP